MLKVIGFVKRHPALTHDEYRLSHVATHASWGRTLKNIRGYSTCVRSNRDLRTDLGGLYDQMTVKEPHAFDDRWDAYGVLYFDSVEDYNNSRERYPQVADGKGLALAPPPVREQLYAEAPHQFHADERVILPVRRPEAKMTKVIQFVKRNQAVAPEIFAASWSDYAFLWADSKNLAGMSLNLRTDYDVMSGFFARTGADGNPSNFWTPEGVARREAFYALWDGIAEVWFDNFDDFVASRSKPSLARELAAAEGKLFSSVWYREVDETINVVPNRRPAPEYYYR